MSSTFIFINNLYCWIYNSYAIHRDLSKNLQKAGGSFISFWDLKSLCLIRSTSLSLAVPLIVICCQSLPLVVPLVIPCCLSMYHSSVFYKRSNWKQSLKEWVTGTALSKKQTPYMEVWMASSDLTKKSTFERMNGRYCPLQIKWNTILKHGLNNGNKRLQVVFGKIISLYKVLIPAIVSL